MNLINITKRKLAERKIYKSKMLKQKKPKKINRWGYKSTSINPIERIKNLDVYKELKI